MITRPEDPNVARGGLRSERPYLYGSWPGPALIALSAAMVSYVVGWFGLAVVSGSLLLAAGLVYYRRRR